MAKLIECIPNFSCSKEKDEATYNALVETAKSVPGCTLFDAQTDGNHNRCVFTLIGSPEAIEEVAFQLTKVATERIDMNKHHGEHKRMGATDVIPFVPQMDVTVEEAVEMSKRVAQRIWDELKVPSFLYEDSATRPERRNLATCRKGEFEGMPEKLLQPDWAPDYGERKIHPTAGITAIGARMPLVAFNVNLATSDVNIAKKIAKVIRASSGGFCPGWGCRSPYTTARLPSASRTASFAPSSSKVSSSPTPTRGRSRRYSSRRRGAAAFAAAASPSVRVPNMLPFRAPVK